MLKIPFTLLEAEVALYLADPDNPADIGLATPQQLGSCIGNLSIATNRPEEDPRAFASGRGVYRRTDTDYQVGYQHVQGQEIWEQDYTFARYSERTPYILTVVWADEETGDWTKLQFYDVTIPSDTISPGQSEANEMAREITFHARKMEAFAGNVNGVAATQNTPAIPASPVPSSAPSVIGQLIYVSPTENLVTHHYNFESGTWTSQSSNKSPAGFDDRVQVNAANIQIQNMATTSWSMALAWDTVGDTASLKSGGQVHVVRAEEASTIFAKETVRVWIEFRAFGKTYFGLSWAGNLVTPHLSEGSNVISPTPANAAVLPGGVLAFLPTGLHVNQLYES